MANATGRGSLRGNGPSAKLVEQFTSWCLPSNLKLRSFTLSHVCHRKNLNSTPAIRKSCEGQILLCATVSASDRSHELNQLFGHVGYRRCAARHALDRELMASGHNWPDWRTRSCNLCTKPRSQCLLKRAELGFEDEAALQPLNSAGLPQPERFGQQCGCLHRTTSRRELYRRSHTNCRLI